mmetsp:Transcript_103049/g.269011  ORF Transcript_103049/g.269011 Transcript_103049/m.269011 type:complete len:116 (-) Transcript_103049:1203-1550(-)
MGADPMGETRGNDKSNYASRACLVSAPQHATKCIKCFAAPLPLFGSDMAVHVFEHLMQRRKVHCPRRLLQHGRTIHQLLTRDLPVTVRVQHKEHLVNISNVKPHGAQPFYDLLVV